MSVTSYKKISYFLIPYLLFWTLGGITLWSRGYEESFLILNKLLNTYIPWKFIGKYLTLLGDWTINVALLLIFFRKKSWKFLLKVLIIISLTGLFVQFFKHVFFEDWKRPLGVFETGTFFYYEVIPLTNYTFPSGHSATSATMFFLFAWFASRRWELWVYGFLGVFTALSRVLIGAHFLGDTLAGSLLGIVSAYLLVQVLKLSSEATQTSVKKFSLAGILGVAIIVIRLAVNLYLELNQAGT